MMVLTESGRLQHQDDSGATPCEKHVLTTLASCVVSDHPGRPFISLL